MIIDAWAQHPTLRHVQKKAENGIPFPALGRKYS